MSPAMRKANAAGARFNVRIGAGTSAAPAWWLYTLPRGLGGKPVVRVGVAADKAARAQVEALLPSEPGVEFVIEMVQPSPSAPGSGLGQFVDIVAPIAAAAIAVGGQVGSALISANANKYAIKTQTKAELAIAMGQQQTQLKALEAQLAAQRASEELATTRTAARTAAVQDIAVNYAPWIGLGVFGLGALYIVFRR